MPQHRETLSDTDCDGRRALPCRRLRHDAAVGASLNGHEKHSGALLPVLQQVQAEYGHVPPEALGAAADALGVSDAHAFGVASFFSLLSTGPRPANTVRICDGPVCSLFGCSQVRSAFEALHPDSGDWTIERTSCLGLCDRGPAGLVNHEACGPIDPQAVSHMVDGWRGEQPSYARPIAGEVRVAMEHIGSVNPDSMESALEHGAYDAVATALQATPEDVLTTVVEARIRGCGGAGFATGEKWRFVAAADKSTKYVVCNADESEPGAFKDRVLLEGDPHRVIEGMLLAAYAVGASHGFVYIRGEYERSAQLLEKAIEDARHGGWLGDKIQGSGFSFDIEVHRGGGAYICGEETALLESLEGRRGEPRLRPPYPTTNGYLGCPTVVNNVETLCQVPAIVARGAKWYRSFGTQTSPGTKMFAITGHIHRPGVVEVPLGTTLRELIDRFGGGMREGSTFKMALTGGAAGTVVPESLLDTPLDYQSHTAGVAMGSGVVIVMDQSVSAATLLHWLLHFFAAESCGKCTPCRQGTHEAREIAERLASGNGRPADCEQLARLARILATTSLCGLGQSVAWPIESALAHFAKDFHEHDTP